MNVSMNMLDLNAWNNYRKFKEKLKISLENGWSHKCDIDFHKSFKH